MVVRGMEWLSSEASGWRVDILAAESKPTGDEAESWNALGDQSRGEGDGKKGCLC